MGKLITLKTNKYKRTPLTWRLLVSNILFIFAVGLEILLVIPETSRQVLGGGGEREKEREKNGNFKFFWKWLAKGFCWPSLSGVAEK